MTDISSSSSGAPERLNLEPPIPPAPPPKKGLSPWLLVLLVTGSVLVVLALLFGLFYLTSAGGKEGAAASSAAIEESASAPAAESPAPGGALEESPVPSSPKPEPSLSKKELYDGYEEIAEDLLEQYGPGKALTDASGFSYASGLFTVRLLDFDGDGAQELYCVFSDSQYSYLQAVYGVKDGRIRELLTPSPCSNNGTDVSPVTSLCQKDGKLYLKTGDHVSFEGTLFTVNQGEWVAETVYYAPVMEENGSYLLNGQAVSQEEYQSALALYEPYETIHYAYDWEENPFSSVLKKTELALRLLLGEDYDEAVMELEAAFSYQSAQPEDAYLLPESDTRYLTRADLAGLTEKELELARNEIYARHGRKFRDYEIRSFFESRSWYRGTVEPEEFDSSQLSDIEKKNLELILEEED